jgi:hypothetical protein
VREGVLVVVVGVDGTAAVAFVEGVAGADEEVEVVVKTGVGRGASSLLSVSVSLASVPAFSSTGSASAAAELVAEAREVTTAAAAVVGEGGVEDTPGVCASEEAAGSPRGDDGAEGAGDGALDEEGLLMGSEPPAAGLTATFFSNIYTRGHHHRHKLVT